MEKWIVAIALLLPFGAPIADEWRTEDTYRQASYYALLLADWRQTRQIADDPDTYSETNPVLGRHPSRAEVDRYFTISALAHITISRALPQDYRSWWQYATIAVQAGAVGNNLQIGLNVDF